MTWMPEPTLPLSVCISAPAAKSVSETGRSSTERVATGTAYPETGLDPDLTVVTA